jgi:twinkle protein
MIDLESLLSSAQQGILRLGCRGLVIDPYNYIQQDKKEDNEHQFINKMLTRLVAFARSHDIHIFLVAHPSKMPTDTSGKSGIPNGHHVSGSAAWFAKCDLGITVHRADVTDNTPEVHCWKCRFKWQGKLGSTTLSYNPDNGIFSEKRYDFEDMNIADIEF